MLPRRQLRTARTLLQLRKAAFHTTPTSFYAAGKDPYDPWNYRTQDDVYEERDTLMGHAKDAAPDGSETATPPSLNTVTFRWLFGLGVSLYLLDSGIQALGKGKEANPLSEFLGSYMPTMEEIRANSRKVAEQVNLGSDYALMNNDVKYTLTTRPPVYRDMFFRCSDRYYNPASQIDLSDIREAKGISSED